MNKAHCSKLTIYHSIARGSLLVDKELQISKS